MDCKADFVIPNSAAHTKDQLQASTLDNILSLTPSVLLLF